MWLLCNLWFNLCDFAPIMYNDKEICVRAMAHDDAYSRMKDVVRWYLSGFYKKPKVSLPSVNASSVVMGISVMKVLAIQITNIS